MNDHGVSPYSDKTTPVMKRESEHELVAVKVFDRDDLNYLAIKEFEIMS